MELALVRPQRSCAARYWSPFVTAHSRLLCFTYPCLNGAHVQLSVPDDTAILITVQKRREGSHSSSARDARLTTALAFKLIPPTPLMLRVNCLLLDDPNSEPFVIYAERDILTYYLRSYIYEKWRYFYTAYCLDELDLTLYRVRMPASAL